MKFSGKVCNGPVNKRLNFGGEADRRASGYRDCFLDSSLRKVVNGHKSAAHSDSPDGGNGKVCFGGDTLCPSASS